MVDGGHVEASKDVGGHAEASRDVGGHAEAAKMLVARVFRAICIPLINHG